MRLALTYAWRELRGGGLASLRQFRIILACLALGVGAIALVGTLRTALARGIAEQGVALLGGDLAIDGGDTEFPASLRAMLTGMGARISESVRMSSLAASPSGDRTLINLKTADAAYPLAGAVTLKPAMTLAAALADHGAVAEQVVFDRLGLQPGAVIRIGESRFTLRAVLLSQPDASINLGLFGPSVIIAARDLPGTKLVAPGALMDRSLRVLLPKGAAARAVAARVRRDYPDQGYRIRLATEAAPGLDRSIDQVSQFLTLVGLASLLVGGIGVAVGVEAWLTARARSIAILRCLGASSGLILAVYLIQCLALAGLGIGAGLFLGGVVPVLCRGWLASLLPVPADFGLYPLPLALAAFYGLVITVIFALAPLGHAARLSGADLFRDATLPRAAAPGPALMLTIGALVLLLVAVTVQTSGRPALALGFAGGAAGTLLLFRHAGAALVWAAARVKRPRSIALRLGLAALHRPGGNAPLMLTALGLGLASLGAIICTETNLAGLIESQIPRNAPSFYFIDIQPGQTGQFQEILSHFNSVRDVTIVPNLRARIVAARGIPAARFADDPRAGWAVRGDRGLTYAGVPPAGTHLVSGHWWPADYSGKPLLSLDDQIAQGLGLRVGDSMTLNILGRDIVFTIANTRHIAWRSLAMNYAMIASPGMIAAAPHTAIATIRSNPDQDGAILRAVVDALPNVTGILVTDILAALARLLRKLAAALLATGAIGLGAGGLVLAGAIAAGQQRRAREAVILKTLGATAGQIRLAFMVEFGAIGVIGGMLAAVLGEAASWAVITRVMHEDWHLTLAPLAATIVVSVLVTLGFGLLSTAGVLRTKPAAFLRNE